MAPNKPRRSRRLAEKAAVANAKEIKSEPDTSAIPEQEQGETDMNMTIPDNVQTGISRVRAETATLQAERETLRADLLKDLEDIKNRLDVMTAKIKTLKREIRKTAQYDILLLIYFAQFR